jgi:hypothetical protein
MDKTLLRHSMGGARFAGCGRFVHRAGANDVVVIRATLLIARRLPNNPLINPLLQLKKHNPNPK